MYSLSAESRKSIGVVALTSVVFLVLILILVVVKVTLVFFALLNYPLCDIANH